MAVFNTSLMLCVFCFTVIFVGVLSQTSDSSISLDESDDDVILDNRILNGFNAKASTYPYMVSLQIPDYYDDGSALNLCGGVIIQSKWILTSAHCFVPNATMTMEQIIEDIQNMQKELFVKAGSVDISLHGPTDQFTPVEKTILHPRYNIKTHENDIALLLLERPLKYNKYVRPISLPPIKHVAKGNGTIIGWGAIDKNETILSNNLLYAFLSVIKRNHCYEHLGMKIASKQLCLGFNNKQNACSGDSGGPFVQIINGRPSVVGVVSYSKTGCHENTPLVCTKVKKFLKFIKHTLAVNSFKKIQAKILNDKKMKSEYPFLAAIMELNAEYGNYEKACTGVIIGNQFVLTTADCFDNREKSFLQYVRVKVGTSEIDYPYTGELYEIEAVRKHPDYYISDSTMKNNLAVIKLKNSLELTKNVIIPFLPPSFFDLEDIQGEIIGWEINNTTVSNNLVISNVQSGNARTCKQLYPSASDSEICVENTNSVCNQDYGSPLIVKTKFAYVVIGLNSIFNRNCENNQPFLVSNVLNYIDFIQDAFNNL